MRVKLTQICVIFLLFLVPHVFTGCAGDQQGTQEAVNAEQGQSEYEEGEYDEGAQGEQGSQGEAEYDDGEETAGDQGENGGDEYAAEGGDNYADEYAAAGGDEGETGEAGNYAAGDDVMANSDVVDNSLVDAIEEDPTALEPVTEGADAMPEGKYAAGAADAGTQDVVEAPQTVSGGTSEPVTATAAALPEWGSKMPYIVKKGDTLGDIAGRVYGNRAKWREMSELSSLINPNLIYIGDVVYYQLTQETVSFATAYESVPRQEVVVQEGDTLSTIASRVMNSAQDWKRMWRENDVVNDPDNLTAGTVLYYVAPGALSAALEQSKAQEYQIVEDVNVEIEDVKIDVELDNKTQNLNKIAGEFSKVSFI